MKRYSEFSVPIELKWDLVFTNLEILLFTVFTEAVVWIRNNI